jgi:hypothetical protein
MVVDSREIQGPPPRIRRRRLCRVCDHRWTTYETSTKLSPDELAANFLDEMKLAEFQLAKLQKTIADALEVIRVAKISLPGRPVERSQFGLKAPPPSAQGYAGWPSDETLAKVKSGS